MSVQTILKKVFGDPNVKALKGYEDQVQAINDFEPAIQALSDEALTAKTQEFKDRLKSGASLEEILPEAFAVVREGSKRTLGMRHFDVQMIGGMVLNDGRIAEMKTGEGKTLVSTLAAYLNALSGDGVYIVTVNDYLAKRDCEWMGQLFTFLGLTVGLIEPDLDPVSRREAYEADITYGTNNEFGFDYLRDNLAWDAKEISQVRRHFAIIDEVDSILIDEARTPLIISGPIKDSTAKYIQVAKEAQKLKVDLHYASEEKTKNIHLTEDGIEAVEKAMGIDNIYSIQNMDVAHMIVNCLKAIHLYKRDADYVVKDGQVMIVDEFTGRILEGRRYSDGLHQAIEATERLRIQEESQTLASITFQNYFRMFPKLAGMTGTAVTEEEEFLKIYGLDVVVMPTNKPISRADQPDVIYKTRDEKYKAIVRDIKTRNAKGQPFLVGTITIDTSEYLSKLLKAEGVIHNVLNAKQHEREAEIIANAGQKHAVTIATNMAGRGTDIVLGEGVTDLGGLYVIGSERHESRRIDNQLRGRSGRQGDPGESKFYVSLEDDLMRLFGSERIAKIMETLGIPDDTPIEHGMISKSLERAQKKVEQYHFSIRKQILEYDDVMDRQRKTVYTLRSDILNKTELPEKIEEGIGELVKGVQTTVGLKFNKDDLPEQTKAFEDELKDLFPIENMQELIKSIPDKSTNPAGDLTKKLIAFFHQRRSQYPHNLFDDVTKMILLQALDTKWKDHLHNMDILREGIGLRAYGQRDPLMEYKVEGFQMFKELLFMVYEETIKVLLRVEIVEKDLPDADKPRRGPEKLELQHDDFNATGESSKPTISATPTTNKIGRNDPCHCGSGKKHKKCCMT
ncbi:preprotein translocase subunit SecA [bacterium]|jgi:preprotein translocase subunit SecA|nr:preprotein translocase subunit SecA [bacterium]